MPKWWPIVVALVVIAVADPPVCSRPTEKHEVLAGHHADNGGGIGCVRHRPLSVAEGAPVAGVPEPMTPGHEPRPTVEADKADAECPSPTPLSDTGWAMFAVTTLYAYFAFGQWRAIVKQGAHAANTERPWIVCEPVSVTGLEPLNEYRLSGTPLPAIPYTVTIRFKLKNGGHSVATIADFGIRDVAGGKLPAVPEYVGGEAVAQLWAPGFENEYSCDLAVPLSALQTHDGDRPAIAVYGQIVYRGAARDIPDYCSRFCLLVVSRPKQPSIVIFGGPDGYNEYT